MVAGHAGGRAAGATLAHPVHGTYIRELASWKVVSGVAGRDQKLSNKPPWKLLSRVRLYHSRPISFRAFPSQAMHPSDYSYLRQAPAISLSYGRLPQLLHVFYGFPGN